MMVMEILKMRINLFNENKADEQTKKKQDI